VHLLVLILLLLHVLVVVWLSRSLKINLVVQILVQKLWVAA
jgi:hypothetical protein